AMMLYRMLERRIERGFPVNEKTWSDEVLPRLAEGNSDHLAGLIVDLLSNPKYTESPDKNKQPISNDGVKYYLFRTLANMLAVPTKTPILKKDSEDKVIQTVLAFVEKPVKFPQVAPREEIDGYRALRREAVKVLALASPTVADRAKLAVGLA